MGLESLVRKTRKFGLPYFLAGTLSLPFLSCSEKKNPVKSEESKQEVVLSTLKTGEEGEACFTDSQTKKDILIKLQDEEDKTPIEDVSIECLDGESFNAFYVEGENYLPATFVFPPYSTNLVGLAKKSDFSYLLELAKKIKGLFVNQILETEEEHKAFYSWQSEITGDWVDWKYVKTVSNNKRLEFREGVEYAVLDIAGSIATAKTDVKLPFDLNLSDLAKIIFREGENMPERWDVYEIEHGSRTFNGRKIQFGAASYDLIPSNVPSLTVNDIKIEDGRVTLSWKGSDKTSYDKLPFYRTQNAPKEDLTVLLGKTKNPDLTYFYKIEKNGEVVEEDSTSNTSVSLEDLVNGSYDLEVFVRDEVGNESEIKKINFDLQGRFDYGIDWIVFAKTQEDYYGRIYSLNLVDPGSGNEMEIISSKEVKFECPVWSSDKTEIYFAKNVRFNADKPWGSKFGLFVINADGTNERKILDMRDPTIYNYSNFIYIDGVSYSPDSSKIAVTFREHTGNIFDSNSYSTYFISLDGTEIKYFNGFIYHLSFSPNGEKVVYGQFYDINIQSLITGDVEFLTRGASPVWSPIGEEIAYIDYGLKIFDIFSKDLKILTEGYVDYFPSWSSDGSKIAYTDRHKQISFIDVGSLHVTQITNYDDSISVEYPCWSRK